jgi:hypothetical protein
MADEFGPAHAAVLIQDLVLLEFGDQTASQLLASGIEPREVWLAICRSQGVPQERWWGLDKKANKRHAE